MQSIQYLQNTKKNLKNEKSMLVWVSNKNERTINAILILSVLKNYIVVDYVRKKYQGRYNLLLSVSNYA